MACGASTVAVFVIVVVEDTTGVDVVVSSTAAVTVTVVVACGWLVMVEIDTVVTTLVTIGVLILVFLRAYEQLLGGTVFRDRRCKADGQVNNHTR